MIKKEAIIFLTEEEVNSSEDIELKFIVKDSEDEVVYTISYPKKKH